MEGEEGRPPSQTPPNFVPSASQPSFPPSHAGFGFQAGPAPPPMASPPFAPHYHPTHLGHAYPAAQSSVGLLSAGLAVSSQSLSLSGPALAPLPSSAPPLAPAPPPSYHPLPPQPAMPPQQGLGYLAMPGHVGGAGGYGGGYGGPGYGYLGAPVLAPRTALSCTNCRKSKVKCERVFPCARCLRLNMHCVEQCSRRGNGGSAPPPPAPHYYPPLPPGYDPPPPPVPSLHDSRDARNGVPSQPAPLSGVCAGGAVLGYGPCSWFVRGYASLSATHSLSHHKATLARRSLAWQGLPPAFLTLLGATEGPPTDKANEKVNGESTEAQGDGSSAALQHVPAYLRELTSLSGVSWLVFVHHHSASAVYPSEGLTLPPLDKERHNALDTLAQLVHKGDHERFLECLAGLYFASPDNPAHTAIIVRGGPSSLPCLASVRLSVLGEGAYSAVALCLQPLPPLPPFLLLAPTRPVLPFDGPASVEAREEARGRKRSLPPPSDQDDSEDDTEEEEDSKPSPCPPRALASASPPLALPPVLGGGVSAPVSLLKAYLASCATVTGGYSEDYSRTHMVQGRPPKEQLHKPSTPQAEAEDTHRPGPGLYECLCVEGGMAALDGLLYGDPQASTTQNNTTPTLTGAAIDPLSLMPQLDPPSDPPKERTSL